MASVIDELVIKIAFDVSALQKQTANVDAQLKSIREAGEKTGKDMEAGGKRAANFFATAKTEALAFMAVLTGGAGLITAAAQTAASIADLGRAATNLNGMDPTALDAWGQALKRIGGNAEDAISSFNNVGAALARYKLKGDTAIIPFLNAIGAQATMSPEQIALKFSEYIKAHPEKTNQDINVIGQGLGMSQSMTNLLREGPTRVREELALSRKLGLRTQDMIETASNFQRDWEALNQAARNLKDKMMVQMMPAMDHVVNWLTDFITEHPQAAEGVAAGGTIAAGALGSSAAARFLGLTGLADAIGAVTKAFMRLSGLLALLGLTGPAGGQATQAETDATTKRLQDAGILPKPDGKVMPRTGSDYLDPNAGPSAWDWIKGKLGFGPSTPASGGGRPVGSTPGAPGPRVGGGGPGLSDPTGGRGSGGMSATERTRAQAVHDGLVSRGMDSETAWAFAGNSMQESRSDPHSRPGDMGRAHGLFMWRDDDASGARAIDFKNKYGHLPEEGTLDEQLDFVMHELRGKEAGAAGHISRATGVGGKAAAVSKYYLRPKDVEAEQIRRAGLANNLANSGRAGPRVDRLPTNTLNGLLPSAADRTEEPTFRTGGPSTSMDIGTIHINTQATNSHGIAKELHGAISDRLISEANRGLA